MTLNRRAPLGKCVIPSEARDLWSVGGAKNPALPCRYVVQRRVCVGVRGQSDRETARLPLECVAEFQEELAIGGFEAGVDLGQGAVVAVAGEQHGLPVQLV